MPYFNHFYELLGANRNCDHSELKKAYRDQARKYHPDVNDTDEAHKMMARINKAYEILTEEDKREEYLEKVKEQKRASLKNTQKKKAVAERRAKKK